jgi:hypothetical protein
LGDGVSVLLPETRALLREVRAHAPFFPNLIAGELFDASHIRGDFKILPRSTGGYVVFHTKSPNGRGERGHFLDIETAHAALEEIAKRG